MTFKLYRVLSIFVFGVLLLAMSYQNAASAQVGLRWDPNDPNPEGYKVFTRADKEHDRFGLAYDYQDPQPTLEDPDGLIPYSITRVDIELPGIPMQEVTYFFVVRAYDGELESPDSEEVFWVLDRTPPPVATDLQGSYSRDTNEITFTFNQAGDRAKFWKIYYTKTQGQDYVEFDTVQNTGQLNPTITKPFTAVPDGSQETVYFTVVSFFDMESFSPNSQELAIDVNRKAVPQPPQNVQVEITIPVQ